MYPRTIPYTDRQPVLTDATDAKYMEEPVPQTDHARLIPTRLPSPGA